MYVLPYFVQRVRYIFYCPSFFSLIYIGNIYLWCVFLKKQTIDFPQFRIQTHFVFLPYIQRLHLSELNVNVDMAEREKAREEGYKLG